MYLLSYKDNNFHIEPIFDKFCEKEEFDQVILYLTQLFLYFDFKSKKYKVPLNRIDEIILWLEKDNQEYSISDECAEQLIILQQQYNKKEVKFFRDRKFDSSILNEGVKLLNYQLESVNWELQRNVYLDCHDAGLGKTIINICVFSTLYKLGIIDSILIIVPIGMGFHWKCQILEFVNLFIEDDIQIIDNDLKIKPFEKFQNKKILIIRQDLLANVIASYNKSYDNKKSLKNLKWKIADYVDIKKIWNKKNIFLLSDENHGFKHTESIKTKALFSIKKYFEYKALLSATPAINGIEDLYSSLSFIDRSIIPMSETAFKLWISTSIGNKWDKYAINSYNTTNVRKLMDSYKHIFIQKRKEDLSEIKTIKIIKKIECEITKEQKRLYQLVTEKELYILQQEYDKITWKLLLSKLHILLEVFDNAELLKKRHYDDIEITNILNKWKIENDPKFKILKSRIEEIIEEQNKKCIIYDTHPDTINSLANKFSKYNPLIVHGGLKVKDRDSDRKEKEDLFNFDKKYKLMILSMYTSSQGINLQYGASNIIFNTLAWDATLMEQAQNRTDRATSKVDSIIELLYYPHTLDQLRLKKNLNRINLNSRMNEEITEADLHKLLNGEI